MDFVIRQMSAADKNIWAEMRHALWDFLPINEHLRDIDKMLSAEKRTGYIAHLMDKTAIGFAEACIRDYANGCTAQPVPFLEGIWIAPEHRRQGVGRALIHAITKDMLSLGFQELCSDADIENELSHIAHEDWGFAETERVVYFRKSLI